MMKSEKVEFKKPRKVNEKYKVPIVLQYASPCHGPSIGDPFFYDLTHWIDFLQTECIFKLMQSKLSTRLV